MHRTARIMCAATFLLAPACRFDPEAPKMDVPAGPVTTGLPESFACTKTKSVAFTALPPKQLVADLEPSDAAPAPSVKSASEIAVPWGSTITIEGDAFGDGNGGEYVSFGEGAREIRVPAKSCTDPNDWFTCSTIPWSATRIGVLAPLGAEGKIAVHTRGGVVDAGVLTPPWRAGAVLTLAKEETYGRTLAAIEGPDASYVVRSLPRDPQGDPNAFRLSVHRFTTDGVSVAAIDDLGMVMRAAVARGANGGMDLALLTGTSRLHLVHAGAEGIDVDDGCVPAESAGSLAFARADAGRVAWVTVAAKSENAAHALVRLVDADATGRWKVDRVVPTKDVVRGEGIELSDGSVGFAWGEAAGGFLDSKAAPKVAVLPSGASEIESTDLGGPMDDYIEARTFATPSGLVITYCNTDDTGFLADESRSGVQCHVLIRTGPRDWKSFDGYPDTFENLDHHFGFVAGHVASVHRVHGTDERVYDASSGAGPSVISLDAREVAFVSSDASTPVLFVVRGNNAVVVRPR